jgi:hypothetical protein
MGGILGVLVGRAAAIGHRRGNPTIICIHASGDCPAQQLIS